MSVIALYYLNKGCVVTIPYEKRDQKNPDLIINDLKCEIKTVLESDWTKKMDPLTGKGEERKYSENICYDLGTFIANKVARGIGQSEVIFADLSLKHFGDITRTALSDKSALTTEELSSYGNFFKILSGTLLELPDPKKNRIIVFSRVNTDCYGFFLDLQFELWDFIKKLEKTNKKTRKGIWPPPQRK